MGNNACRIGYVCSRVDDPDDYDYTFVRIFGVFCLVLGIAAVVTGAIAWGFYNTLPYGAWWGPILSIVSIASPSSSSSNVNHQKFYTSQLLSSTFRPRFSCDISSSVHFSLFVMEDTFSGKAI
jgi:hypothetical protein